MGERGEIVHDRCYEASMKQPGEVCMACRLTPYLSCRDCVERRLMERVQDLESELASIKIHNERLELAIWDVIDTAEEALHAYEQRVSPSALQVPYHGYFAGVSLGTTMGLARQAKDLRDALRGMWPMTRSEFVALYPSTDPADLDRMFAKRVP